jgi:tRNA-dihydrouridine synthase
MKLFLAPLQGLTNYYYRNIYQDLFEGIDLYYAPFITTSNSFKIGQSAFKDILPENNNNIDIVVPQLLSNDGEGFRKYAAIISEMGYKEINWNLGCPYPTVTKKKRGSGLLPYPDMIRKVLDEACKDTNYNLTVKMRLGLHDPEEGFEVMEVLNDYPISGVMLHARIGKQKYEGTVDLDAFEEQYKICKHDMTYNGDIYSYEDYVKIQNRFPNIDKFMIGRGALMDPFLPSLIKNNGLYIPNEMDKIKELHDRVFSHYETVLSGEKHLLDRMKEFWTYLSVHIDPSVKFLKSIKKSKNKDAYLNIVNNVLNSSFNWRK